MTIPSRCSKASFNLLQLMSAASSFSACVAATVVVVGAGWAGVTAAESIVTSKTYPVNFVAMLERDVLLSGYDDMIASRDMSAVVWQVVSDNEHNRNSSSFRAYYHAKLLESLFQSSLNVQRRQQAGAQKVTKIRGLGAARTFAKNPPYPPLAI
jgi:hypothetical protein